MKQQGKCLPWRSDSAKLANSFAIQSLNFALIPCSLAEDAAGAFGPSDLRWGFICCCCSCSCCCCCCLSSALLAFLRLPLFLFLFGGFDCLSFSPLLLFALPASALVLQASFLSSLLRSATLITRRDIVCAWGAVVLLFVVVCVIFFFFGTFLFCAHERTREWQPRTHKSEWCVCVCVCVRVWVCGCVCVCVSVYCLLIVDLPFLPFSPLSLLPLLLAGARKQLPTLRRARNARSRTRSSISSSSHHAAGKSKRALSQT